MIMKKETQFYQMFPELVIFPPNARLMQNLFLARLIPDQGGCIIIGQARSNKHSVKKEEFSGKYLIS